MDACSKHLSAHLEEISLATLPRTTDDDDVAPPSESSSSAASIANVMTSELNIRSDEYLQTTGSQLSGSMEAKLNTRERDFEPEFQTETGSPGKWKCDWDGCGQLFDTPHRLR